MIRLRGGVLIVGSLLWDNRRIREDWRGAWLALDDSVKVQAPIRYGRRSRLRGCTYTVVFSRLCLRGDYEGGVGIAVPFQRAIAGSADLLNAAWALWRAESLCDRVLDQVSASWGAIGILANPSSDAVRSLLPHWAAYVGKQRGYGSLSYSRSEGPALHVSSGQLRMPWPHALDGSPCSLDFLLATATDPSLSEPRKRYPTADQVARAWIVDGNDEVRYFRENRRCGITTFHDDRIRNRLQAVGIESV